jgi:hypothetical protein
MFRGARSVRSRWTQLCTRGVEPPGSVLELLGLAQLGSLGLGSVRHLCEMKRGANIFSAFYRESRRTAPSPFKAESSIFVRMLSAASLRNRPPCSKGNGAHFIRLPEKRRMSQSRREHVFAPFGRSGCQQLRRPSDVIFIQCYADPPPTRLLSALVRRV